MGTKKGNRVRRWTSEEDRILRERFPHEPTANIAEALKRSIPSVDGRARKWSLKKTEECIKKSLFRNRVFHKFKNQAVEIGSERVYGGYRMRKTRNTSKSSRNWEPVHRLLWMEHNGPIPYGHFVVFRDGNKDNITIENLECVPRSEMGGRNSYHNRYPKELAEVISLRAALVRKINRHKKEHHE